MTVAALIAILLEKSPEAKVAVLCDDVLSLLNEDAVLTDTDGTIVLRVD